MPLALVVVLLVACGTALAGFVGYLIDRSASAEEQPGPRRDAAPNSAGTRR